MLLDLLLPQRCAVCGAGGETVCAACVARLPRLAGPLCARCGAPTAWPVARCRECAGRRLAFASARAAVAYDDAVRRLVAAWKERGLRAVAELAAAEVAERIPRPDVAALVPVAPDPERLLKRGHHPAGALAAELGVRWELPVLALLSRRHTPPQRGRGRAERRRVEGFVATGRAPAHVALVDDVYTTGATASAAASALRRAGARHVRVISFARAIRR